MDKLDLYLDEIYPIEKKMVDKCCIDKRNIILSPNLLMYVCIECGKVQDYHYLKDYYDKFKNPLIVKTYIPYTNKYHHLHRLNKWSNYNYHQVQLNRLLIEISIKLKDMDREVVDFTKIFFSQIYKNLSIRGKIKDALVVYCIFKSSLMLKKDVDIDDLLEMFNISIKNYNDLNKKLPDDKLLYFKEMNYYINITNNIINKNKLIQIYNDFLIYNQRKFNNKSIILGIISYILRDNKDFDEKYYRNTFGISKISLINIKNFIIKYKII